MAATETRAPRRADARRNIAAILDAATRCLSVDPHASLADIARAAGVGRVTLYAHFENRAGLIAEVVARSMRDTNEALDSLDLSGEPLEAMALLLEASWHLTHRFGGLVVAAGDALPAESLREAHAALEHRVVGLLERGRRAGVVRRDQPLRWQVATTQAVLHGAVGAVQRNEVDAADAPDLIIGTVLPAIASRAET